MTRSDLTVSQRFTKEEKGGITVLNVFFVIVIALLGGVAVDMANLISARTQLQIAADTAAHAAIYTREGEYGNNSADVAKARALELAKMNMPNSAYGDVLTVENIHFGTFDKATQTFSPDDDFRSAVYVKTDRLSSKANAVTAFLMQFAGFQQFDVVTTSVFETYRPTCLREGFVANGIVDIQSNNAFTNGFCIHSNTHVEVNQNNFFEDGTIVSLPGGSDNIVLPSSGYEKNEGLGAALRHGSYWIRILEDLEAGIVEARLKSGDGDNYTLGGLQLTPVVDFRAPGGGNAKLEMSDLIGLMGSASAAQNRIYEVECGNNNNLTLGNAADFVNVVILTDCEITFAQGAHIIGTTILTRSTDTRSVKVPNGLTVGADDNCGSGGGAQILTHGGINGASELGMFGGRIVALGDVSFTAQNDGIEGASIIAGGEISITSGSDMGFCNGGMTDTFEAEYFRMAG